MNNIIVLLGWKGSGKDTVAEYLEDKYNYWHLKFARYIKNAANAIFPDIPLTDIEYTFLDENGELDYWEIDKDTPRKEFYGLTKRDVLINLARHLKSLYGEDIFVNNIDREIKLLTNRDADSCISPINKFVISDLRFQSEYDYLNQLSQESNYYVYFLDIRKSIYHDQNIELYTDYKQIRKDLYFKSNLNYNIIYNDGTISDLYNLIDTKMEVLKLK